MGSSLNISQQSAVETINQWRSQPLHKPILDSSLREISQYLQAIDKLKESNARGSNDKLISTAMDRLEVEFEAVLRRNSESLQPDPTDSSSLSDSTSSAFYEDYHLADAMNDDVVAFLRNVAERMNSRKIDECVRVYKQVRKLHVQSQLKRLRFDELRCDHQRRYFPYDLKVKMELWIQVSKVCVKVLFEKERKLCDQIFGTVGYDDDVREDCFMGTVKDSAVLLFRFVENLSSRKKPYEMMVAVLGVYEAFLWVLPSADALFASAQGKGIRDFCTHAYTLIQGDAARMLYDLQHDVLHEKVDSKGSAGREVHPTTKFVVEQIKVVAENKDLLKGLIKSAPSLSFGDAAIPEEEFQQYTNGGGFLEQHLVLTILVLLRNLEMKSRSYRDPCLGHLFVMNNLRCILKTIEGSHEPKEMVGARLVSKMSDDLGSARASYETITCDKFLTCLRDKGININRCCFGSQPSKAAIKRRLKRFNDVFESVNDLHSSWKIPDYQLREEGRPRMSEILVPRYTKFLAEFGNNPETRLIVEGNMRHSAEDLEALIQRILFANSEF